MGATGGIKTFEELVQTIINEIKATQPNANTTVGTFARDVLVDIPARGMSDIYSQVTLAQQAQSVRDAVGDHLDRLLANWAVYRRAAVKATGHVWFYQNTLPTADVTIPAGTRVRTSTTVTHDAVEYVAAETKVIYAALANSYYNPNKDVYEIEVAITAAYSGIDGNVGPETIVDIVSPVSIPYVTNTTSTTGGTDGETDDELRTRGLSALQGSNVGTKAGYEILVETIPQVVMAVVVDPNDSEMERVRDGGGADVWVYTESTAQAFLTYTYPSGELTKLLDYRPVLSISSVTENGILLVPGIDYSFVEDIGVYSRSIYANDRLHWITVRAVGATIVIEYTYSDLISSLQATLNSTTNHIVGVDVLTKAAYSAEVNITMMVEVFSGYDSTEVTSGVNTAIAAYIDSLMLGETVQQSDVVALAESAPGVDSVVLPIAKFSVVRELSQIEDDADEIEGVSTGSSTGNLMIRRFEKPEAGTITVNYYV